MSVSKDHMPVFRCQREGFEAISEGELLGSFDGRDLRELHAYRVADRRAQLLVSMHERLHHELQWSTVWGVVAAMAGLLADEGVDPERLRGVALMANSAARRVHELFATTIGAGVLGIPEARRLLAGNGTYLRYLEDGLALGGPSEQWPWQFRESAAQMLLRSMMQPAALADVAGRGFAHVKVRDVAEPAVQPDKRLAAVEHLAGSWWKDVFDELIAAHPERGGDRGGEWERSLPEDVMAMDALKAWEESVLIPSLQDVADWRLRELGYDVLGPAEYLDAVEALRSSFVELGPDDWQVEVLTGPRRMTHEPLGAEREAIRLRDERRAAAVVESDEFEQTAHVFLHAPTSDWPHALAVYALPDVLRRQFAGLEWIPDDAAPLLALVSDPAQAEPVRLAVLDRAVSPRSLAGSFGVTPVVTLTTLSTTREPHARDRVLDLEQVLVLVDLPLRLQVEAWLDISPSVRFRVLGLEAPVPLNLTVFRLDELPNCWFLSLRSEEGFAELAQLIDRHEGGLVHGLDVPEEVVAHITAAVRWVLATWRRVDELGPDVG